MSEDISHNCGLAVTHTLHDAYSFIESLQHRGREAAGIAAIGKNRIDVVKWQGNVKVFDHIDLQKMFPAFNYYMFIMHVRYATKGLKTNLKQDAHPHVVGGKFEDRGDHIIILDCDLAAAHNGTVDDKYFFGLENKLVTGCDTEGILHFYNKHWGKKEEKLMKIIPGAYTLVIADKRRDEVIVMRDRTGVRPGVLGWKDGKHCVASEDIALRKNGAKLIEDLDPGSIYYLYPDGNYSKKSVVEPELAHCFFEWNYLADVDSILNGVSVKRIRQSLGEILAEEFNPEGFDLVTYVPRCPEDAARSFAKKVDLPFMPIFYKMRSERSFQGSTDEERKKSIDKNLFLLPRMEKFLKGKRIIVIDDSTIRGTNAKKTRQLLYETGGVEKAILGNYTPEMCGYGNNGVKLGCSWGVDMPPEFDGYVARGRTSDEISAEIGMETFFISFDGMMRGFEDAGIKRNNLCTYCIGGKAPF